MSAAAIALLQRIAELAAGHRPLAPGLRDSEIRGAGRVADALDAGADLATALSGAVPRPVARELAHAPDLLAAATLAADELELRRERRERLVSALGYPALCLLALTAIGWGLHLGWGVAPSGRWLWWGVLLPALLAAALLLPAHWPLGPLTAWRRHAAAAGRYARAALVARWRLDEAEAGRLLGRDLERVLPLLASVEAESACRRLRRYHRGAARRAQARLAWLLALACYLAAAGVVLAAMEGFWQTHIDQAQSMAER